MSSERQWKCDLRFHISVLMQGDSRTKPSDFGPHCEGGYFSQSFCDYCLPNLNPSFSQPLVLCLPGPTMEVSLHSCLGCSFPSPFFCRPRCVSPLVGPGASACTKKSSLTRSQNLLDCCLLWHC